MEKDQEEVLHWEYMAKNQTLILWCKNSSSSWSWPEVSGYSLVFQEEKQAPKTAPTLSRQSPFTAEYYLELPEQGFLSERPQELLKALSRIFGEVVCAPQDLYYFIALLMQNLQQALNGLLPTPKEVTATSLEALLCGASFGPMPKHRGKGLDLWLSQGKNLWKVLEKEPPLEATVGYLLHPKFKPYTWEEYLLLMAVGKPQVSPGRGGGSNYNPLYDPLVVYPQPQALREAAPYLSFYLGLTEAWAPERLLSTVTLEEVVAKREEWKKLMEYTVWPPGKYAQRTKAYRYSPMVWPLFNPQLWDSFRDFTVREFKAFIEKYPLDKTVGATSLSTLARQYKDSPEGKENTFEEDFKVIQAIVGLIGAQGRSLEGGGRQEEASWAVVLERLGRIQGYCPGALRLVRGGMKTLGSSFTVAEVEALTSYFLRAGGSGPYSVSKWLQGGQNALNMATVVEALLGKFSEEESMALVKEAVHLEVPLTLVEWLNIPRRGEALGTMPLNWVLSMAQGDKELLPLEQAALPAKTT